MVIIVAKCTVKEDKVEEFKHYSAELVTASNQESGCISYELCQDLADKTEFVFIEKWQSHEAIEFHNNSKHFTTIVPKLGELQVKEADVTLYTLV